MDNKKSVAVAIAGLDAIKWALVPGYNVDLAIVRDFHRLIAGAEPAIGERLERFHIPSEAMNQSGSWAKYPVFKSKLEQAIVYLKAAGPQDDDSKVVRAGALYTAIVDSELRGRCSDLLTATSHFDRAINQATLILEDRIRRKSGSGAAGLTGTELVNRTIKSDPSVSTLVLSEDKGEQEGMANLCRGMMLAYRNETHHHLTDRYTREDALRVCGFIDLLLRAVDEANVRPLS
jgi:uncharacterized protein (TIGR02391 family)